MNSELYHYGVKGMKWGVRRKRRKAAKARERDISYTGRQAMTFAGMSNSFRKGEILLKLVLMKNMLICLMILNFLS